MSRSPESDSPRSSSPSPAMPDEVHTPTQNTPFLSQQRPQHPADPATPSLRQRSASAGNFVSSPLNPAPSGGSTSPLSPYSRSRPASRGSMHTLQFNRIPSDDSQAFSHPQNPFSSFSTASRGSMVLYRFAEASSAPPSAAALNTDLQPPRFPAAHGGRDSVYSTSGDSFVSMNSDSKYPSGFSGMGTQRGLVPYAYDPADDAMDPPDEDDMLHDPDNKAFLKNRRQGYNFPWRGFLNISALIILVLALLLLFIFYPVLTFMRNRTRFAAIDGNIMVNGTGQVPVLFQIPGMIDIATPDSAKTRTGFDGEAYELVFSDEFDIDGRTFYPGDDPYWEAVDLWYGVTADLEWYDPSQVTTANGSLVITLEDTQPNLGSNASATADPTINHGLRYKSGMLQSWNKFCFTTGYIEVSLVLPGPNADTQGYWPGVWTMGNLGRPGYPATTDGTWPYTYDSCDVGVLPNQTYTNGSGPADALDSPASKSKYDFALSWLPGQRASACTCSGEEHPGPSNSVGRGAPEIDVLEVELSKSTYLTGQIASQSSQFAPFNHDYTFDNSTTQAWNITDPTITMQNSYAGSALQQAVSGLTQLPTDMFQGQSNVNGGTFRTMGFEYWSDPNDPTAGFITWQVNGTPSVTMGASAVGADPVTQIGQRLVSVEPMAIIMNLGISAGWQTIDTSTMIFPAQMFIDYIRVYQRAGQQNTNCSPSNYPTEDYINNHLEAYTNYTVQSWGELGYPWPRNSQADTC